MAIADVYSAGEPPIEGISRDTLVGGLIAHGHRRALPLAGEEALADFARAECRPGDLLVCLGAGSISAWANALPERLNEGEPPQRSRSTPEAVNRPCHARMAGHALVHGSCTSVHLRSP